MQKQRWYLLWSEPWGDPGIFFHSTARVIVRRWASLTPENEIISFGLHLQWHKREVLNISAAAHQAIDLEEEINRALINLNMQQLIISVNDLTTVSCSLRCPDQQIIEVSSQLATSNSKVLERVIKIKLLKKTPEH